MLGSVVQTPLQKAKIWSPQIHATGSMRASVLPTGPLQASVLFAFTSDHFFNSCGPVFQTVEPRLRREHRVLRVRSPRPQHGASDV